MFRRKTLLQNLFGQSQIRRFSSTSASSGNHQSKLFLAGEFTASSSTFDTINPASGEVIAQVSEASGDDVDRAVSAASDAFDREQSMFEPSVIQKRRQVILQHLADCLEKDSKYIAKLETLNCGKPLNESEFDVACSVKCLRYYASLLDEGGEVEKAEKNLLENDADPNVRNSFVAFKRKQPLGVAALITPFNYPLLISTWKIAPALASGCTVIHKPAEQTPLTALRFAEYFSDFLQKKNNTFGIFLPEDDCVKDIFHVLPGRGHVAGEALVSHPAVEKVSFTGSTATGQAILAKCATSPNLKRVSLELGGKSPLVVHKDADLDAAVDAVFLNGFGNSGQICTASSRILCHEDISDVFEKKLTRAVSQRILVGDCSRDPSCTLGPVISAKQKNKIMQYILSGAQQGARICRVPILSSAARRSDDNDLFVTPVVFAGVRDDMTIAREEIFGPVVSLMTPYNDDDVPTKLFDRCNDTKYGLAAGIFTKDEKLAKLFCRKVNAGTIWVNGSFGYSFDQVPFGGFRSSGLGRELGGQDGIDSFMETKAVVFPKKW